MHLPETTMQMGDEDTYSRSSKIMLKYYINITH